MYPSVALYIGHRGTPLVKGDEPVAHRILRHAPGIGVKRASAEWTFLGWVYG
jgi:hypothetical protein